MRKKDPEVREEEKTATPRGNYLQAFFVLLFITTSSASMMLLIPSKQNEIPVKERAITTVKSNITPLPTKPVVDTLAQTNRRETINALSTCLQKSVEQASKIVPPVGMVELSKPNFPPDTGFGPIVVHQEVPGSAYIHLLYSTTPLPEVGSVDPYAAPLIVDTQLQKKFTATTLAVGVSTPVRGSVPNNWLNENINYVAKCLKIAEVTEDQSSNKNVLDNKEPPIVKNENDPSGDLRNPSSYFEKNKAPKTPENKR